jgi:hypothetical protein
MSYYRFDGDDGVGSVEFRRNKFAENSGVQCRFLAQSGNGAMSDLSPLSGVKRKSDLGAVRSAFDPGADMAEFKLSPGMP